MASLFLVSTPVSALAAEIMPGYATLPAGWVTDRYDPAGFANVGNFQGHSNVLGISIDASTGFGARPGAFGNIFYSTQGRKYTFAPPAGAGSTLSADLYIPASWGDAANGNVRTDMWGTMVDGSSSVVAYSIVGFTNYGGAPRLRVWDSDTVAGWVDLATPVAYGTWHRLSIELMPDSTFRYYINGTLVYTDLTTYAATGFAEVIMQAYNFEHPTIPGAVLAPYTAHWSNTVGVPSNKDQCKNGGWANLRRPDGSSFKNQGDCIQYVNTGK